MISGMWSQSAKASLSSLTSDSSFTETSWGLKFLTYNQKENVNVMKNIQKFIKHWKYLIGKKCNIWAGSKSNNPEFPRILSNNIERLKPKDGQLRITEDMHN